MAREQYTSSSRRSRTESGNFSTQPYRNQIESSTQMVWACSGCNWHRPLKTEKWELLRDFHDHVLAANHPERPELIKK